MVPTLKDFLHPEKIAYGQGKRQLAHRLKCLVVCWSCMHVSVMCQGSAACEHRLWFVWLTDVGDKTKMKTK